MKNAALNPFYATLIPNTQYVRKKIIYGFVRGPKGSQKSKMKFNDIQ